MFISSLIQNLIDLAGSESSKTETTGIRRKEGSYINKSLLTLGTVSLKKSLSLSLSLSLLNFSSLLHIQSYFLLTVLLKVIGKLSEGKASHVPYRDSKLTRLLQSSLSGHGHVSVSMVIC